MTVDEIVERPVGSGGARAGALLPLLSLFVPSMLVVLAGVGTAGFVLAGVPLVVVAIASERRLEWERSLGLRGLPERESWLPALYLVIGFGLGVFDVGKAASVIADKSGLIAFILAFALVSEGLSRSGLFHFLAFRIAERCEGSTGRLLFYLFVLASVLTAFTSNDIVVLALTPIVISVCYQARIRNVRLILLSTFVAANTLSMSLLIGSPTNIILGEALGLNGFSFTLIMAVPSLFGFLVTYLVISRVVARVERRHYEVGSDMPERGRLSRLMRLPVERWDYSETYTVPRFAGHHRVTPRMVRWIWVFAFALVALTVVSMVEASLWWCAIPIAVVAIVVSSFDRPRPADVQRTLREELGAAGDLAGAMPWGILFFGLAFFVVAAAFSDTDLFRNEVVGWLNSLMGDGHPLSGVASIGGTGLLVNAFNDLPAAALLAETLPAMTFDTDLDRIVVAIGVLAGLNIGTYLTPTGALAGLIWFRVMRREADRVTTEMPEHDLGGLEIPRRSDLIRFGVVVFTGAAVVLGLVIYGLVALVAYLLSDVDSPPVFADSRTGFAVAVLGLSLAGATVVMFRRELKARNVVIAHLRDAFVFLHRFSAWALRHRLAYGTLVVLSVLVSAAALLYWGERYHSQIYGTEAQFEGLKGYVSWLVAFMGSGYEQELFPVSLMGIMMCGMLPLLGIAVIVRMLRAPADSSKDLLRSRLASGEAAAERTIVVGRGDRDQFLVELMLRHSDRFVVLLTNDDRSLGTLQRMMEAEHRLFSTTVEMEATQQLVEGYRLLDAREVLLLSDGSLDADYENMRLLGALDDALHMNPGRLTVGSERVPQVLVECANSEMEQLIRRSISHELAHRVCIVTVGEGIGEYLATDVVGDLRQVERLYRFEASDDLPRGMQFRSLGDQGVRLALSDLSPRARDEIDQFRNRIRRSSQTPSSRVHTSSLRSELEESIGRAAADAGLRPSEVVGLEVAIGPSSMLMGVPTAALSAQTETARRAVTLGHGVRPEAEQPSERVHIVNVTHASLSFARTLLQWMAEERLGRVEIFVHASSEGEVPSWLSRKEQVWVGATGDPERVIDVLTAEEEHSIRPGDKVYVFAGGGQGSPGSGLDVLRFIRSLDSALAQTVTAEREGTRNAPGVQQKDVYIAVESRDASTRFLFEQMFVDKIIDTHRPRENFLRNFVEFFYRRPSEERLPHGSTDAEFRLAVRVATFLRHYAIFAAKDEVGGGEVLAHMPFDRACVNVRTKSEPPQQLVATGTISVAPQGGEACIDVSMRFPDADEVLVEDDRLFLVTII